MDKRPKFLIIGVQKGGTTTLFDLLNQIPIFSGAPSKEVGYFSKSSFYERGSDWYSDQFQPLGPKKIYFEATPAYIYHPDAPGRIYSYNPRMKLIVILREPAARAYSAWNMFYGFNKKCADSIYKQFTQYADTDEKEAISSLLYSKEFPTFRDAIKDDLSRYYKKSSDIEPSFVRRGIYHEQIARFLNYFDLSQFLFLEQQDLNKIGLLMELISKFLEIKIDYEGINQFIASNKGEYMKVDDQFSDLFAELKLFYAPHNECLFRLIGKKYEWS